MKRIWNNRRSRLILAGTLFMFLVATGLGVAAQDDEPVWSDPVNLSRSGVATDPTLIVDNEGGYHLFWQDQFAGYYYTSGDGETWSEPVNPAFPFNEPAFSLPGTDDFDGVLLPLMTIDDENRMHAFWSDDDDLLLHSRAGVSDIASGRAGWSSPVRLGQTSLTEAVAVDADGRIHLIYINTQATTTLPTGIIYVRSTNGGQTWSAPVSIYQSDYLRSLSSNEANIRIAAGSEGHLFVAWDNPGVETLFFTRSLDGGETWLDANEVDRRTAEDPSNSAGPSHIEMFVDGTTVNLTWRAGHVEEQCIQYVQSSPDNGETWGDIQAVYRGGVTCPSDGWFIQGSEGLLLLATVVESNVYMQAQDGNEWSQAVFQGPLGRFTDAETFRIVNYGCHQTHVTPDNNLFVAGCGRTDQDDIWVMSRPLGTIADWSRRFVPTSVWRQPETITNVEVELLSPQMVIGSDGRIHAFWSQSDIAVAVDRVDNAVDSPGNTIYYSRFEADMWSSPRPVLNTPDGNRTDQPTVAADNQGSLFVAWSGDNPDGVYFSRALADRAASVTEWVTPQILPGPRAAGSWPDMMTDGNETIYIAYSIPLNEDRGIYLSRSTDDGDTWQETVRVFDGVAADWPMVGQPHLARSIDGTLHLIWTRRTSPPESQASALVYARSTDDGDTWSEPALIEQGTVVDSHMVAIGELAVHRIWVGLVDGRPILWHQWSTDGGLTWSNASRISEPALRSGPATLIVDHIGDPLILQLVDSTNDNALALQEWVWREDRWLLGDSRRLSGAATNADAISAIAAPDSKITVLYGNTLPDNETGQLQDVFIYTSRDWEAALMATPTPLPTLTATPIPEPTDTPVPEPTVEPTPTLIPVTNLNPFQSGVGGIIAGVGIALLLVGIFFLIGLRVARSR